MLHGTGNICLRIHVNINVIGKIDIISDQRNKYGRLQERLHDLWEKYSSDDLSDSHFLMECVKFYGSAND